MSAPLLDSLFALVRKEGTDRHARDVTDKAGLVRGLLMPHQVELEDDDAARIAVRSPRRTGKSTAVVYIATIRCLEQPGARWIVVCLTRTSAALRDYWASLQVLNSSFELGIRFNGVNLIATFKNGATIKFVGADSLAEIEKLRGSQYDGVIVDECKSFDPGVFEELIQDVIEPALLDRAGVLYVIGTPGDHLDGPFYRATSMEPLQYESADGVARFWSWPYRQRPSRLPSFWSLHTWTLQDNTTVFKNARTGETFTLWDKALEVKARRGWTDDHPTWRREYLGHWVASNTKFVYRWASRHEYAFDGDGPFGLPGEPTDTWHRVLGMDLGTRDGTAIVVWAFSDHHPGLYELYGVKESAPAGQKLPISKVAAWYKEVEAEFGPFDGAVCDYAGLATMVMDTLGDDYEVYLDPAEKKQKNDFITLFNTDLDNNVIFYRAGGDLAKETAGNRWNARKLAVTGKREEDPATPNDLADAGLYAWRLSRHRKAKARGEGGPAQGSEEWWAQVAAAEMKAARDTAKAEHDRKTSPLLDADWWTT